MEGILKVTPEKLEETASAFSKNSSTVKNLTNEMVSKVNSMSSSWQGDASTAYIQKFMSLEEDINKINTMIQEHITDLGEMAAQYRAAESANVEMGSGLQSNVLS